MPNWCYNDCFISGPKNEVKPLYEKLNSWVSKNIKPNGFGLNWLGNIVLNAGFSVDEQEKGKDEVLRARGSIINDFEYHDDDEEPNIWFTYESAWAPFPDTWKKILRKHAPHCKFYYFAEEPGMGIYETNDINGRFFANDYYVETNITIDERSLPDNLGLLNEIYYTIKDLKPILQQILGSKTDKIETLVYDFNNKYAFEDWGTKEGYYFNIHKIECYDE